MGRESNWSDSSHMWLDSGFRRNDRIISIVVVLRTGFPISQSIFLYLYNRLAVLTLRKPASWREQNYNLTSVKNTRYVFLSLKSDR